jgi:hypothetical protein
MSIAAIVALIALAQWMIFAVLRLLSRAKPLFLGISTGVFAIAWIVIFAMALPSKATQTVAASAAANSNAFGCLAVEKGMSGDAVQQKAGKPDEKRSDEDTRGPGASIWIYRDARCSVHLLGDRVEFVE